MYQRYKDRAQFFVIYIREAHPGQRLPTGGEAGERIVYRQPKDMDQRAEIAKACLSSLNLTMPFLLDDMKGATEKAYSGWPNRIYVIDYEGKVAMKGPKGPRGADLSGAARALKQVLAKGPPKPPRRGGDPPPPGETETK